MCERRSSRSHQLRDLLTRNGVPHVIYETDSPEGRRLLEQAGKEECASRWCCSLGGGVLVDRRRRARRLLRRQHQPGGSLGVRRGGGGRRAGRAGGGGVRLVGGPRHARRGARVDRRPGTSSLIRNYLGFARGVSGSGSPSAPTSSLDLRHALPPRAVTGQGRERPPPAALSDGSEASAAVVVLATSPPPRRTEKLEELIGTGVFYGASVSEARTPRAKRSTSSAAAAPPVRPPCTWVATPPGQHPVQARLIRGDRVVDA